jgi:glycosyltransferase 2 family protein
VAEALLILAVFGLPASLLVATVIEAFGSGVRFATFFVPASLGALDGANAGAFAALGWTASARLAFSVVRRARQAVWIGVGLVILLARNASLVIAAPHLRPDRPDVP